MAAASSVKFLIVTVVVCRLRGLNSSGGGILWGLGMEERSGGRPVWVTLR